MAVPVIVSMIAMAMIVGMVVRMSLMRMHVHISLFYFGLTGPAAFTRTVVGW